MCYNIRDGPGEVLRAASSTIGKCEKAELMLKDADYPQILDVTNC